MRPVYWILVIALVALPGCTKKEAEEAPKPTIENACSGALDAESCKTTLKGLQEKLPPETFQALLECVTQSDSKEATEQCLLKLDPSNERRE